MFGASENHDKNALEKIQTYFYVLQTENQT